MIARRRDGAILEGPHVTAPRTELNRPISGQRRLAFTTLSLQEVKAIKTPGAKQTRAAKQIDARARIALSGTPVENRLGDLWSIFDFLNPGLLGSGKAFSTYTKRLSTEPNNPYARLRALVRRIRHTVVRRA